MDVRRAVIQAHFDEGVHFHDPDGEVARHAGLEAFSDSPQNRFPGARFTLAEPPRTVGNAIRAFWHFGRPGNPRAVSGMDFVILDGEKASNLYAFVYDPGSGGQPPSGPCPKNSARSCPQIPSSPSRIVLP